MTDALYAAPVVPGPAGARRPARWEALPSRVVWPVDPRVAHQLHIEVLDHRKVVR